MEVSGSVPGRVQSWERRDDFHFPVLHDRAEEQRTVTLTSVAKGVQYPAVHQPVPLV